MSDRPKMVPRAEAPAGLETDGEGNAISVEQHTLEDRVAARSEGTKNPDHEAEIHAPMVAMRPADQKGPGPNQAGKSPGNGKVDPQGQQGGTEGGSPAVPKLPNEIHPVASARERARGEDDIEG